MKIKGYDIITKSPMIFASDICDKEQAKKLETNFYFFGSQIPNRRGNPFDKSPLNKLVITWNPKKTREPLSFEIKPVVPAVVFEGNPSFSQRIPNKSYLPSPKSWHFVSEDGTEYGYNIATKEARCFGKRHP